MRDFETIHPAAVCLHLLLTAALTLFCLEPLLLGISLLCGIAYFCLRNGTAHRGFHFFALGSALLLAVCNPLWNQHGETVLFVLNDRAYTLEALCYGAAAGLRLSAVLYWFRNFSDLMTSDKLFCLFRFFSPKLALVFSMSLRNVSLFRRQMQKIHETQRAAGLYREGHLIDDLRGGLRVFSILVTWALENGIITASSMTARGYGCEKRTGYSNFNWRKGDTVLLLLTLVFAGCTVMPVVCGALERQYYPTIIAPAHGAAYFLAVTAYAALALLPILYAGKETLTWHCLRSGI